MRKKVVAAEFKLLLRYFPAETEETRINSESGRLVSEPRA
jgi:hypothetical protein